MDISNRATKMGSYSNQVTTMDSYSNRVTTIIWHRLNTIHSHCYRWPRIPRWCNIPSKKMLVCLVLFKLQISSLNRCHSCQCINLYRHNSCQCNILSKKVLICQVLFKIHKVSRNPHHSCQCTNLNRHSSSKFSSLNLHHSSKCISLNRHNSHLWISLNRLHSYQCINLNLRLSINWFNLLILPACTLTWPGRNRRVISTRSSTDFQLPKYEILDIFPWRKRLAKTIFSSL